MSNKSKFGEKKAEVYVNKLMPNIVFNEIMLLIRPIDLDEPYCTLCIAILF